MMTTKFIGGSCPTSHQSLLLHRSISAIAFSILNTSIISVSSSMPFFLLHHFISVHVLRRCSTLLSRFTTQWSHLVTSSSITPLQCLWTIRSSSALLQFLILHPLSCISPYHLKLLLLFNAYHQSLFLLSVIFFSAFLLLKTSSS